MRKLKWCGYKHLLFLFALPNNAALCQTFSAINHWVVGPPYMSSWVHKVRTCVLLEEFCFLRLTVVHLQTLIAFPIQNFQTWLPFSASRLAERSRVCFSTPFLLLISHHQGAASTRWEGRPVLIPWTMAQAATRRFCNNWLLRCMGL